MATEAPAGRGNQKGQVTLRLAAVYSLAHPVGTEAPSSAGGGAGGAGSESDHAWLVFTGGEEEVRLVLAEGCETPEAVLC